VTVGSYVTVNNGSYVTSTGGTVVNGSSSQNSNFALFTTVGGSINVTYSTAGASVGTASVQIVPATPAGSPIGNTILNGGVWAITITN